MDVTIQEMTSRLQITDSQALLDPRVLEQIVRMCVQRVQEEQDRAKRANADRELTPSVMAQPK